MKQYIIRVFLLITVLVISTLSLKSNECTVSSANQQKFSIPIETKNEVLIASPISVLLSL
jgi:cytosine/uracil/thiamine/allantoin permease